MTIAAERTALAAALATVDGLRSLDYFPDVVNVPVAIVAGPTINFNVDQQSMTVTYPVYVLVSTATNQDAQRDLDGYLDASGTKSIRAAIQSDDTLGGVVQYALVTEVRDYGIHDVQGNRYLGAVVEVTVVDYQ